MTLETRDITARERHRAAMHHARWVLTGLAIPLVWTLLEGPDWIGLALTLAVCALAGWVYAHGWRHRRAGYALEVKGARLRVEARERVPYRLDVAHELADIIRRWRRYTEPSALLDGLVIRYVEDVQLEEGDTREVEPRARYLDHPIHRVEIEADLMTSTRTLAWEIGHPLTIAIAREEGLPMPGEREGWEREWYDWRRERGLL
jgi:hypothetical protein